MARYRIGNDITVVWTVNDRNGDAFSLENKDVHLYYTCERGRFEADIKIKDTNKIVWDFYGSLQTALGVYSLTLVILQSEGKRSIKKDICNAFTFVGKDCEADAPADYADGDLSVYQETITTDLDVLRINPIVPTIEMGEDGIGYWVIDGVNTGERATAEGPYEFAVRKGYEGTEEEFTQLLIEDSPITKGDSENSAVLKGSYEGKSNKAISQTAMAVGAGTTAGLKGWYYSEIDFSNKKITLSDKPTYFLVGTKLMNGGWSSGTPNINVGDKISIVNDSKYDYCGEVSSIKENIITLKDNLPFTAIVKDENAAIAVLAGKFSDGYSLYLPDRPEAGIIDFGGGAFAEGGLDTKASNICAHAEGLSTHAYGQYGHAEGRETKAGYAAHAEGLSTIASGLYAHAEGTGTLSEGSGAHAEGYHTKAIEKYAHAEGRETEAQGANSHSEGQLTKAKGANAHAEGNKTTAHGSASHSEGLNTTTAGTLEEIYSVPSATNDGDGAHAEGNSTIASGNASHAEGYNCQAIARCAHAEGRDSIASGQYSHAENYRTKATNLAESARGKYNNSITSSKENEATIDSVGIGSAENDRRNAYEVKKNGDIYVYGIGNYNGANPDKAKDIASVIKELTNKSDNYAPDWDAAEDEAGYIKNRTHYKEAVERSFVGIEKGDYILDSNGEPDGWESWVEAGGVEDEGAKVILPVTISFGLESRTFELTFNHVGQREILENEESENSYASILEVGIDEKEGECYLHFTTRGCDSPWLNDGQEIDVRIESFKRLNDGYIPSTIARKSDLEGLSAEIDSQNQLIEDLQNTKIDKEADDYYPQLSVGVADNLAGVEVVDSSFTTRQSGGGAITDGVARVQSIKGNSVVWNQWALSQGVKRSYDNSAGDSISYQTTGLNVNYTTAKNNHKIFCIVKDRIGDIPFFYFADNVQSNLLNGIIFTANTTQQYITNIIAQVPAGVNASWDIDCLFVDLTKMFGEGNEPSTIEEFYQRIPSGIDLNAYNEGEVVNMNVDGIKSVGRNAWDEQWELGLYKVTDGTKVDNEKQICCKNFVNVLPNTQYYITRPSGKNGYYLFYDNEYKFLSSEVFYDGNDIFTTPSNAAYLRFYMLESYGTTYNHDICINLSDASVNGKYFPYEESSEDLSIVGKYFPNGMRSAGTAHDEIRYNKATQKWEKVQRIGSVDFGTLNLYYISDNGGYFYGKLNGAKVPSLWSEVGNILAAQYNTTNADSIAATGATPFNMSMGIAPNGNIYFVNTAYTNAASFRAAMSGVILYYELAEPIVTELDEQDFNTDYLVWNGGTEEALAGKPSSALRAEITYGFNAVGKIKELEEKINTGGGGVSKEYIDKKVTELSTQVGTLSERVDELGEGGSSMFEAVYGETPFADMWAAYQANKHIICRYGNFMLSVVRATDTLISFSAINNENVYGATCTSANVWASNPVFQTEKAQNKTKTINEASTDTQYPSAKAVYDFVQSQGGGGGTNEEMQRILAGNSPNLIWEDLNGKLHYEHGELASRKAQNDPTFRTTCRRILSCSPSNTEELVFLFGVQNDIGTIEDVYPYLFAPVKLAILNFAFSGAPNIKDWSFLKLFNTSNVTSMVGVFYGASADYIDVSNWDTSNVTKMGRDGNAYSLFGNFRSIIGLNKWNVSKVENMARMFSAKIEDIGDVSTWDVSSCSSFENLFRENSVIKNIDLSSWAIKSGASISNMFFNMNKVETIGFPNIANGCTAGSTGRYLESLTSIFFKEGSTFGCSLSFNESPLTAESVKQLLAHASSTPDEGATLTFKSGLYASFSEEDKAEIDALRNVAVANGWTIVNMG